MFNRVKKRSKSIPELIRFTKSKIIGKLTFKPEESDGQPIETLESDLNLLTVSSDSGVILNAKKRTSSNNDQIKEDQVAIGDKLKTKQSTRLMSKAKTVLIRRKSKNLDSLIRSNNENEQVNNQKTTNSNVQMKTRSQSVSLVGKNDSMCFCSYF